MHRHLQFRVWRGYAWLHTLVFWLGPAYVVYNTWANFQVFRAHPSKFAILAVLPFLWYVIPFAFGNLIIQIRREGDELVFSNIGRPPLMPWGTLPTECRVPALASFSWSRPQLSAVHGEYGWQFTLAVFIRSRQIPEWFQEVGLPKPHGF